MKQRILPCRHTVLYKNIYSTEHGQIVHARCLFKRTVEAGEGLYNRCKYRYVPRSRHVPRCSHAAGMVGKASDNRADGLHILVTVYMQTGCTNATFKVLGLGC